MPPIGFRAPSERKWRNLLRNSTPANSLPRAGGGLGWGSKAWAGADSRASTLLRSGLGRGRNSPACCHRIKAAYACCPTWPSLFAIPHIGRDAFDAAQARVQWCRASARLRRSRSTRRQESGSSPTYRRKERRNRAALHPTPPPRPSPLATRYSTTRLTPPGRGRVGVGVEGLGVR